MITAGTPMVLGIGNLWRRDDGVGVRVVEALRTGMADGSLALPPDTDVLDGGTVGLGLLAILAGTDRMVIVDAREPAGHPGTVSVLRGAALLAEPGTDGALDALLATAAFAGALPRRLTLVGIEARDTGDGVTLTPAVEAAIGPAVATVIAELREPDGGAT